MNGWAIYQTLACRIFGRSSLYQSGGAYGFRDQLQDVCAVIDEEPHIVREHLLRAAAHQFEEGDVQHWWHPSERHGDFGDKGVRTRCSDDLLWLPYALCVYVEATGDKSILTAEIPYIRSQPLAEDEDERYEQPKISSISEPLLNHAVKAVELVLTRHRPPWLMPYRHRRLERRHESSRRRRRRRKRLAHGLRALRPKDGVHLCADNGNPGTASRFSEAAGHLERASC